jgi:hypothetical protein
MALVTLPEWARISLSVLMIHDDGTPATFTFQEMKAIDVTEGGLVHFAGQLAASMPGWRLMTDDEARQHRIDEELEKELD